MVEPVFKPKCSQVLQSLCSLHFAVVSSIRLGKRCFKSVKECKYFYLTVKLAVAREKGQSWVSYTGTKIADTYCGLATMLPGDGTE